MIEGKRRFFPFRWGMGDLLVVLSFGLLGYLSFHPLELGVSAAKKEIRATKTMETWMDSLNRRDLHDALADFIHKVLEDRRFQLVEKEKTGIQLPFVPILQDLDFQYGISLVDVARGTPQAWIAKERTGNKLWVLGSKPQADSDPRHPRARLKRLGKILNSSRFMKTFSSYWKGVQGSPDLKVLNSGILQQGTYDFVHTLLEERGRLGVGIYAWPDRRGRDGFAAFFVHPGGGMRQTRNIVHAYQGLKSFPLPRAGLRRPSSKTDHKGEYTGLDGNTWFPIQISR